MPFRPRHRRWIALIALLGLLFQQVAMAAYICPLNFSESQVVAEMNMPGCEQAVTTDKALCQSHCHPQAASSDHGVEPTVPAAILPPTTWVRAAAWQPLSFNADIACEVTARAAAPPRTIRFCSFQI